MKAFLIYFLATAPVVVLFFAGVARGREMWQRRRSYHHALRRLQKLGLITLDANGARPTRQGLLFNDDLVAELL